MNNFDKGEIQCDCTSLTFAKMYENPWPGSQMSVIISPKRERGQKLKAFMS